MLHEFLTLHRGELIERCKSKAALRFLPASAHKAVLPNGVPLILDQLIETLRADHVTPARRNLRICGGSDANKARPRIDDAASQHGFELLRNGFPVEEIVYGYGDLCQAITDLVVERNATIQTHEFRTVNHCLDKAIADALISYSARPHTSLLDNSGNHERLGFLAHELRNHLQTATLAIAAIRAGNVGAAGATAAALDRSMAGMCDLVDRSLTDVRAMAQLPARLRIINLADFIAEIRPSASLQAEARGCVFVVEPVDTSLGICVDRDLLFSALANLLQNAFKFTRSHTEVTLKAFGAGDRVLIAVQDNCGGLPAGDVEQLFQPFTQFGHDKSGVGLGLSICRRSVDASGGVLSVRDIPGAGCIFTIDLPRQPMSKQRVESSSLAIGA
ncbi:MAG TPA: HAMP domain-containing sensor histidine kinase [Woeseiaceae bacterium]|nr:HAMP domain-containing sensor histidine kinase [Woeseiaceae bacterium]